MSASILLAEDDQSLRFVLSQALSKEGFDVRVTSNVATLSKWVREGEGDLVLSDVYMGEQSLFDALPALRAARPNLPVIVMSAQSTVATARTALGAGAYDYIAKPFDLDHLMAALEVPERVGDGLFPRCGPRLRTRCHRPTGRCRDAARGAHRLQGNVFRTR